MYIVIAIASIEIIAKTSHFHALESGSGSGDTVVGSGSTDVSVISVVVGTSVVVLSAVVGTSVVDGVSVVVGTSVVDGVFVVVVGSSVVVGSVVIEDLVDEGTKDVVTFVVDEKCVDFLSMTSAFNR
jgi:hypothetical protein